MTAMGDPWPNHSCCCTHIRSSMMSYEHTVAYQQGKSFMRSQLEPQLEELRAKIEELYAEKVGLENDKADLIYRLMQYEGET